MVAIGVTERAQGVAATVLCFKPRGLFGSLGFGFCLHLGLFQFTWIITLVDQSLQATSFLSCAIQAPGANVADGATNRRSVLQLALEDEGLRAFRGSYAEPLGIDITQENLSLVRWAIEVPDPRCSQFHLSHQVSSCTLCVRHVYANYIKRGKT